MLTSRKFLRTYYLHFVEASLPNIHFAFEAKRKAALDVLHRFLKRNVRRRRKQKMHMIGHDDKRMNLHAPVCHQASASELVTISDSNDKSLSAKDAKETKFRHGARRELCAFLGVLCVKASRLTRHKTNGEPTPATLVHPAKTKAFLLWV
jgi:hypothetical protein